MDTQNSVVTARPPRLFPSFLAGFNTIASHIQLILLPLLLDLFFWFGPRLRLKAILESLNQEITRSTLQVGTQEMIAMMRGNEEMMQQAIERFNLFSALRSIPVGVFSLLANQGTLRNPLGQPLLIEPPNELSAALLWVAFSLLGLILGTFYFSEVARFSREASQRFSLQKVGAQFSQILLLVFALLILILAISAPAFVMILILTLISPSFAQIGVFVITFFILWLALPLLFSPHGIFWEGESMLRSVLSSARLVRFTLPTTGLFLMSMLLLNQLFNLLWTTPPETSWMLLVGIFGHAFTATSLLAGSFLYYRDGKKWMEYITQELLARKINPV